MTRAPFYALAEAEQIKGLADLGRAALARWELGDTEIRAIAYRENMTFGVDAGRRGRFALRVHQAGYRTDAQIESELAFMQALVKQGVLTPEVVPASDGAALVVAEHPAVPEARQCDLFEWIDGRPLRASGDTALDDVDSLAASYRDVGRLAAAIGNVGESWQRPPYFERPAWNAEGIFGENAHLGNFRELRSLTAEQLGLFERVADKLSHDLASFGQSPDRFGLSHGDFLPENIMVCGDGIRLIDFDDCGDSWALFDFATALFDLIGEPAFDPCLGAMVEGYRERRSLPDEHLVMLPAFFLARSLSYVGWSASRSHLKKADQIAPRLIAAIEAAAPGYLAGAVA